MFLLQTLDRFKYHMFATTTIMIILLAQGLTLKRHIEATLGSGNIREAVQLPPGEDLNEWLAVNTVDFYNAISVLFGTLEEFCTSSTCPVMSAGPKVLPDHSSHTHNCSRHNCFPSRASRKMQQYSCH